MKIKRQNLTEDYSSSSKADWIDDFSKNIEKSADYLANLKTIMKKRNDFSSIEEKMADIRTRAGFDLIKDIDSSKTEKIANATEIDACSCSGKKCRECNPELFRSLRMIVNYIKDLLADRPELGALAALTICRQHPSLGYAGVARLIDEKKLKALIEKLVGEKDVEEVKYIPEELSHRESDEHDIANEIADYMQHAQTG
jgi:hypothetical protein